MDGLNQLKYSQIRHSLIRYSLVRYSLIRNIFLVVGLCFVFPNNISANAENIISAGESKTHSTTVSPAELTDNKNLDLGQIVRFAKEGKGVAAIAQVTSVSQLSDVKSTDWAFTSLQSLVERYGCIAGYPDKTFRGQRSMTRFEFAAGLNACLDKANELITSGLADKVGKEDLATLQRLQEEFASELSAIKGRVDTLESKVETLEAKQFSTTTKLGILGFFNLTGATAGSGVKYQSIADGSTRTATNPNTTLSGLIWLDFKTSFTGKDLLVTQLAAGNGTSPANNFIDPGFSTGFFNSAGTPFTDQTAGTTSNSFVLRELSYQFPVFDKATIVVGPRVNFYKYFDTNRFTLFLNGTSSFNSINSTLLTNAKRGAGAILLAPLGDQLDFKLGYLGESNEFLPSDLFNTAANPRKGLFSGNNALTAELAFKPSRDINLRLLYSRTNSDNVFGCVGGVGATPSLPGTACALDRNNNGTLANGQADVIGFNFDWLVSKGFGLFGRYTISFTNLNSSTLGRSIGGITTQAFQIGAAFPDLFKQGAQGTVSLVMPWNFTSGRNLLTTGSGDGGTQYELETAYFYPLTKNIALVPALYFIFNPNNFNSNPTITVANLRLQFGF